MRDIFVSYAQGDRDFAQRLVSKLREEGFSVWWDPEILPGGSFDHAIEEAISQVHCVIVLWSRKSIKSDWVKSEAEEAMERGILLPILMDDVKIPMGFRRIEAARLIDWKGDASDPEFRLVAKALARRIPEPRKASAAESKRRMRPALLGALAFVQFAGVLVLAVYAFDLVEDKPSVGFRTIQKQAVEPAYAESDFLWGAAMFVLLSGLVLGRLSWDARYLLGVLQGWAFPVAAFGCWVGHAQSAELPMEWLQMVLILWGLCCSLNLRRLDSIRRQARRPTQGGIASFDEGGSRHGG